MKLFNKKIKVETSDIRSIIDGTLFFKNFIRNNFTFVIFFTFLMVFRIGNRYKCEEQLTRIAHLEKEITDLHYEAITTSAELMSISRQSEVLRLVKDRGIDLNESVKAPQRIYIEEE